MMSINLFFEFLQVAIGNRETLSRELSDNDWQDIFLLLKKHALLGVGFTAVERLHVKGIVCPAKLRMQWYALVVQIEKRNVQLNELCKKVTEQYEHDGLSTCILKGQGNQLNYPEELRNRRMPGDIDLWCATPKEGLDIAVQTGRNTTEYIKYYGVKAVIEYVKMLHRINGSDKTPRPIYHHVDAPAVDGIEVEAHYRTGYVHSPLRNWRMQRWFSAHQEECVANRTTYGFSMPTPSVNVIYQMTHLFSHYFQEGIGLKQFLDLYFTLIAWKRGKDSCGGRQSQGMWSEGLGTPVMSATEIMAVLRSFGMGKFAGAVMYVLHEVFGGVNENDNENENCPQMNTDGHGCPQADEVGEQQLSAIGQQLKEIGPQADEDGEQQLFASSSSKSKFFTHCQYKEEFIKLKQVSAIGQQLSKKYYAPWLICEPNEKEGRKLLAEIMQGGNFGQYDTRDAALKKGGMMKHGLWKLKRVMRLVRSYPEEALWEPVFRVYHLIWRGING